MFDPKFANPNAHHLTHANAIHRDSVIAAVDLYQLSLNLFKTDRYQGTLIVDLDLKKVEEIFFDFHGEQVKRLEVNGKQADQIRFEGHKLYLPTDTLNEGKNQVLISFENTYVTNSAGLHRFQDPEDGNIYLYTHLEPFFCNRWFPCFDQPSIRAPLRLKVVIPDQAWKVFANSPQTRFSTE